MILANRTCRDSLLEFASDRIANCWPVRETWARADGMITAAGTTM
jgi:hypothetical protein